MIGSTSRFGIILRTERFEACVSFYRDILGLDVWYEKEDLVCLRYGSGYLMVEKGGHSSATRRGAERSPHTLRFDVAGVAETAAKLREQGIDVQLFDFEWGSVAAFADPDGNPCELKNADDPFFA